MSRPGFLMRFSLAGLVVTAAIVSVASLYLRADKRAVFREVAGDLGETRELESVETAGGTARHVELANDRGEVVASVWMRRPRTLAPDYRIILVYSGENTGRKILDLIPERDDLVLVAPQYPYARPKGLLEKLRWPASVRRAAFRTVASGMLTVTWLERAERLETSRLLLVGASLGSSFAVIHASLDPRVPRLLVVHGGGDLPLIIRTVERERGHPVRGAIAAALASVLVDSFDPLHYVAAIAPREVVVIGARGDHQFPAASTQALFEAAGEPKSLRWTSGAHLRSARDAALEEVLGEIERVLAARD